MLERLAASLGKLAHRQTKRRWARAAAHAASLKLSDLRKLRAQAKGLRSHLDTLIHTAEDRLALPSIGSNHFHRAKDSEWAWRPKLWRGALERPGLSSVKSRERLGDEVTLFHDCRFSEMTLRQVRNTRESDLAPYGLRLDVLNFDGSFLSLVLDLPSEAMEGLTKSHILQMDCIVEMEKPLEIFARLNVQHGPNTEQIVRELPLGEDSLTVEFDLAYSKLNEKRVEKGWIDLIFEGPQMNEVTLRDLTFLRRRRANL